MTLSGAVAVVVLAGCTLNVGGTGSAPPQGTSTGPGVPSTTGSVSPTNGLSIAKAVSPTTTTATSYETVKTGVVRIQSAGCTRPSSGTGFFVGKNLIVTAAHVVTEANTIAVRSEIGVGRGIVIGIDPIRDIALLQVAKPKVAEPLTGYVFTWSTTPVKVGDSIAVIGYPLGMPVQRMPGSVTGLNGSIDLGGKTISGLITYDAKTVGGNSGGPMVDARGHVVGMVDARSPATQVNYAISTRQLQSIVDGWAQTPVPIVPVECGEGPVGSVSVASIHPEARSIALTLDAFFTAINQGEAYSVARENGSGLITSAGVRAYGGLDGFIQRYGDADVDEIRLLTVESKKGGIESIARVDYRLRTLDPDGADASCVRRQVEFTMSLINGSWQIAQEHEVTPGTACAP